MALFATNRYDIYFLPFTSINPGAGYYKNIRRMFYARYSRKIPMYLRFVSCVGTAYVPCPSIRIATPYRVISTAIWSKPRQFYQSDTEKSIARENIFISLVSTVNADGLAPSGARTSACTLMTRFVPRIQIYGSSI